MLEMQFDRFHRGEKVTITSGMLTGSEATIYLTPADIKAKDYMDKKPYVILLGKELTERGYGHDCGGLVKTGNGWFVSESSLEHAGE